MGTRLRVASALEMTTPSSQVSEEALLPSTLRSIAISEKVRSGIARQAATRQRQGWTPKTGSGVRTTLSVLDDRFFAKSASGKRKGAPQRFGPAAAHTAVQMPSAYHDAGSGSIERGNNLGDRSSVRQSKYFREYESGNNVKSLLGTDHLRWDVERKEGVFSGHSVYDGAKQDYVLAPARSHPPAQQHEQSYQAELQQQSAPRFGRRSEPPPPAVVAPPARGAGGRSSMDWTADALWQAVGDRDLGEVTRLLRQGADPNMVCPDGWVRDECRPKEGGVGRSVLHHAAWTGDLSVFKALVDAGADVDRKRNTAWRPNGGVRGRGSTPMHHACMYGRMPILRYCLEELGCEIDAPGEQGYTCLHLAAKFNYPALVEYLLKMGARTDMLTRDEKTARELAEAKQERSHAQMGDMLAAFDRFDAEARRRPKQLPGAPLGPDPRLAASREQYAEQTGYSMQPQQPWQPPAAQQQHNQRQWQEWKQQQQQQPPQHQQPSQQHPLRMHEMASGYDGMRATAVGGRSQQQQQHAHPRGRDAPASAAGGGALRPDQAADQAAAATRLRAMGSRLW